jgi:hypothetical protein
MNDMIDFSPFVLAVALASYFGTLEVKRLAAGKSGAAARFFMVALPLLPVFLGGLAGAAFSFMMPGVDGISLEGAAKGFSAGLGIGASASKIYEQARRKFDLKMKELKDASPK